MSGGIACTCEESKKPLSARNWVVTAYHCNFSAFNGNRQTPSAYSAVLCNGCETRWRTKAAYVEKLKRKVS